MLENPLVLVEATKLAKLEGFTDDIAHVGP